MIAWKINGGLIGRGGHSRNESVQLEHLGSDSNSAGDEEPKARRGGKILGRSAPKTVSKAEGV